MKNTRNETIKLPIAAFAALIICVSVMQSWISTFIQLLDMNYFDGWIIFNGARAVIPYIFLCLALFMRKRNWILVLALGIWLLQILSYGFIQIAGGFSLALVYRLFRALCCLGALAMAVLVSQGKEEKIKAIWFVPGVFSIVGIICSIILFYKRDIFGSCLECVLFFSLGYWMAYPYKKEKAVSQSSGMVTKAFCTVCGKELAPRENFCVACGAPRKEPVRLQQPYGQTPVVGNMNGYSAPVSEKAVLSSSSVPGDAPSAGMAVLGFFLPIVGLILWLIWKDSMPMKANSAGKGAIVSVVIYVALPIILIVAAAL